jgi:hypothetical protein
MPDDLIRYDLLAQQALRGVVRNVLADVAKKGLPGDHHFKITFNTTAPGVRLSDRLRAQYPETMTIILQHLFWDLAVSERAFEIGLSFGGVSERLAVPFDAIVAFYDPAVQFGFQFESIGQTDAASARDDGAPGAQEGPDESAQKPGMRAATTPSLPAAKSVADKKPAAATAEETDTPPPDSGGGEVVRLDRFRKK